MRWLPLLLIFLFAYLEITLFIKVASVLGVAGTLMLVIVTSCFGVFLIRNQGIKTFIQIQQKITIGENPAGEMVKSVSLVLAGFLLLIPGFFTDFLGLLLLIPAVQRVLTLKLIPYLSFYSRGYKATYGNTETGHTFEGEFYRKDNEQKRLDSPFDDKTRK